MIKQNVLFMILLTFLTVNSYSQDVNQYDSNNQRHGYWTKNYKGTQLKRYEGQFVHGKEVDTFKYYKIVRRKSVLAATKVFNKDNDIAEVVFYSSKGDVISQGKMNGKLYIGQWTYFHNKSKIVMSTEFYNDEGKLNGEKKVFYLSGKIAEKLIYKDGLLHGEATYYAENGTIVKSYVYVNDELHGMSKHYTEDGNLQVEGRYKNGKKHGVWKYYSNGIVIREKDFTVYSKNPYKKK